MKKPLTLLACACALFIAGCSKGPDAVALDYFETIKAGKLDEAYAKANCTDDTAKMICAALALGKGKEDMAKEMQKEMEGITFTVTDTKIDGDNAVVTIKAEGTKGKKKGNEDAKIKLKKVDGKWKIHQSKEDIVH